MREEKKNAKKIYKEEKQTNKIREKKKKGTAVIRIFQVFFFISNPVRYSQIHVEEEEVADGSL